MCVDASKCARTLLLLLPFLQLGVSLELLQCSFGTTEGRWEHNEKEGSRWQLFDDDCQLQNLLEQYKQPNNGLPPASILLLGDSVDEYMVGHMCTRLSGVKEGQHFDRHVLHTCRNTPGHVVIGQWYVPGVSLTGPFHERHRKVVTGAIPRSTKALATWRQQFGRGPDAVVLSSNFWDLARVHDHEPWVFRGGHLPRSFLDSWQANFTKWAQHVRSQNPQGLLMYHTSVYPNFEYATGIPKLKSLQNIEMINDINAAGRHVSTQLGIAVVDMQRVAAGLVPPTYLQDDFHPGSKINAEVFNVYLNLILQHKRKQQHACGSSNGCRQITSDDTID